MSRAFKLADDSPRLMVGVGGIGTGMFFELEGDHTLGRNESRPGRVLDVRDYCKLHIIAHYVAVLLGAEPSGSPFHVLPVGKVGDDAAGRRLKEEMAAAGMDLRFVDTVEDGPTLFSVCFQYPDGSGGNITTSDAVAASLREEDVDRAGEFLAASRGRAIALAAPEAPLEARLRLLELATEHDAFRAVALTSAEVEEAKRLGMFAMTDLLSVNEDEAGAIAGGEFAASEPGPFLKKCAEALTASNPDMRILLSAGKAGAFGFEDGEWDFCPALEVEVASTAGAGDALLGGTIACLAAGVPLIDRGSRRKSITARPLSSALDFGVLLAGFTVTSPHTIHPDADLDNLLTFAGEKGIAFGDRLSSRFHD